MADPIDPMPGVQGTPVVPAPTPAGAPPAASPSPQPGEQPTPAPVGDTAVAPAPVKVPEKFLKDGKPDVDAIVQSYTALERQQFKRREDLKAELAKEEREARSAALPASPADYVVEPIKLADGRSLGVNTSDPVFQFLATAAHDLGVPNDKFNALAGQFALAQLQSGPKWDEEAKVLGQHAEVRLERVDGWARAHLSQKAYDAFARVPATADAVALYEEIMELTGAPKFVPVEGGGYQEKLTMEDVRKLQASPEYRAGDRATVDRVRAGLRQLTSTASGAQPGMAVQGPKR